MGTCIFYIVKICEDDVPIEHVHPWGAAKPQNLPATGRT